MDVNNTLLHDFINEQINILHVTVNGNRKSTKLNYPDSKASFSFFLLGFSFLFVGLGYIKTGIEEVVQHVDLKQYENSPVIIFFVIGFIITTIIQSSSATMALTLSALHAGAINLHDSMAITLGSEVGTTIKLFIASIKGSAVKKRVALGNFLINIITVGLVIISHLTRFLFSICH